MTPGFEIKRIRPWTRKRRGRNEGPSAAAERDERSGDLTTVLEAYDRRFESAAAEKRTEAERQEQFRADASRLLETVIGPTLREVGEEINQHGHTWDVESRVDILAQPALACSFSPREARNGTGPSELTFRFHFPDRLMVQGASNDGSELSELPPRSYGTDDVDAQMVRAEVTRFVTTILG